MNSDSSLLLYVIGFSLILFIAVGFWFFRYAINKPTGNETYFKFKAILDNKLIPLGFHHSENNNPREITTTYDRDFIEIALSFEPPFRSSRIYIRKGAGLTGENILTLDLDSDDVRNHLTEILDKWLEKNL